MFNETLLEDGYAQVYTVPPNDRYEDRFEEAQEAAQEAEIGIWGLSSSEQDLLADRGNGIGGEECSPRANSIPPPPPPPAPIPAPDVPEPDVPEPDVPEPDVPTPDAPPTPAQPTPSSGANCKTSPKNVPVAPGSKGDGDGDGIACES
jgi:Staphylococcal nuclease homologue